MRYNDIVSLIKTVAEEINPTGTFIHGRKADGSIIYDKPLPQIHLYPFITTKDRTTGFDNSDVFMGFWFQDKPTNKPEQRQEIISKADDLCQAFIEGIEATGQIQLSNVRVEPQYQTLAATLSGYALRFNILSQSESTCP